MPLRAPIVWILAYSTVCLSTVNARKSLYGDNSARGSGFEPSTFYNEKESNGSNHFFGFVDDEPARRVFTAYASIAGALWILVIPTGGMLLRLNFRLSDILRIHAAFQITGYLLYITAVGLGNWLIRDMNTGPFLNLWNDPHPHFGFSIILLSFIQPFLGFSQHRMFKERVEHIKSEKFTKAPGLTIPAYMEVWLARDLIALGIINGDLGLRIAGEAPFQSFSTTGNVGNIYVAVAVLVMIIYLVILIRFEANDPRRGRDTGLNLNPDEVLDDVPSTHLESNQSSQKVPTDFTRDT